MPERTLPIRYPDGQGEDDYLARFSEFADAFDLRESRTSTHRGAISREDILEAMKDIFWDESDEIRVRANQTGDIGLPDEFIEALCKEGQFTKRLYSSSQSDLTALLSTSPTNTMPCLGAWLWTENRLILEGGFITFRTDSKDTLAHVVEQYRAQFPIMD